jgi:serine protease AprX
MTRDTGGTHGDVRKSALWGSGNRGGEHRSNALWGKGGRGLVLTAVAVLALAVPFAGAGTKPKPGTGTGTPAYVAPSLLTQAKEHPGQKISVIVQSAAGAGAAETATQGLGSLRKRLGISNAVAVELPASRLAKLSQIPGLTITPDAPVKTDGSMSYVLWPYESGNSALWAEDAALAAQMPTVAIVDSGIAKSRPDFGGRVIADVNLTTLGNNSPGDGRGHGTFVAGVAAGNVYGLAGAAPQAKLVSLDVMDDRGMARTSDVIAAAQWIYENKDAYNIRVANFSLHSATPSNFTHDPLDRAVEKLWFSGVVVVAAAGNYGNPDGPSGVGYAPGNDPFVITVGAIDLNSTASTWDDQPAAFSAYGYTHDGFWKPEVSAAGRYMIGPVPLGSTLTVDKAANMVHPAGYIQLSGTSFAAPIVSGTAAQILARHPNWTPGQVKGALMMTARKLEKGQLGAGGVGQITATRSAKWSESQLGLPPNPNAAIDRFVVTDAISGGRMFDAVSWADVSWSDVSWDAVSWSDVSWADVSWSDVSWADVSWSDVSWADVSWSDVSWADVSWSDVSWEDAAEGEATNADAVELAPDDAAALTADPQLGVTQDMLPAAPALELIGADGS